MSFPIRLVKTFLNSLHTAANEQRRVVIVGQNASVDKQRNPALVKSSSDDI
jgi:hypothetical protein